MRLIAGFINEAIEGSDDVKKLELIRKEVLKLTKRYPLYPELSKE
jgi:glycine/serine hydroxymethyltransferase